MDELSKVVATPTRLHVGDRRIEVKQISLEILPEFMAMATPILNELMLRDVMRAVGLNLRACQSVAALLTGQDVSWVAGLSFKDQVHLFATCLEVNHDFFVAEVIPGMLETLTRMASFVRGLTQSMISSPQDTTVET